MKKGRSKMALIGLLVVVAVVELGCGSQTSLHEIPRALNANNLPSQQYTFSADESIVLNGTQGTVVNVPANAFVDEHGNAITGSIEMELKECLSSVDMVLGNMTTVSDGRALESGGMVFIQAKSKGKQVFLTEGSELGVEVRCDQCLEDMKMFQADEKEWGLNWVNPVELNTPKGKDEVAMDDRDPKNWTNVSYSIKGYDYGGDSYFEPTAVPEENIGNEPVGLREKVQGILWGPNPVRIRGDDSLIIVDGIEVTLIRSDIVTETASGGEGTNMFLEDVESHYIFSMKKLGWANIDRLHKDPRTQEVELLVNIRDHEDYDAIYVSMIFKKQNMYLPGYQKKDKSFGFTHGDFEKTSLPVGETATILVTAYKKNSPHFTMKTLKIEKSQEMELQLMETTIDGLKQELTENI